LQKEIKPTNTPVVYCREFEFDTNPVQRRTCGR